MSKGTSRRTLRVLRAEREMTQKQMATLTGLTQTRTWQIEHGQGAPLRPVERQAIARALKVPAPAIAWPALQLTPLQVQRAQARAERDRAQVRAERHRAPADAPLEAEP